MRFCLARRSSLVQAPPFTHSVSRVTPAQLPYSWRAGCPVAPSHLRRAARQLLGLRRPRARRHAGRERRRRRRPVARLLAAVRGALPDPADASDRRLRWTTTSASLAADNTSAFNCRYAVASGPRRWSVARLRPRDRRQPGREPLPRGRSRAPAQRARLLEPRSRATRDGGARRGARARVRSGRLVVGRPLDRHRRTTSTSLRPAARRGEPRLLRGSPPLG